MSDRSLRELERAAEVGGEREVRAYLGRLDRGEGPQARWRWCRERGTRAEVREVLRESPVASPGEGLDVSVGWEGGVEECWRWEGEKARLRWCSGAEAVVEDREGTVILDVTTGAVRARGERCEGRRGGRFGRRLEWIDAKGVTVLDLESGETERVELPGGARASARMWRCGEVLVRTGRGSTWTVWPWAGPGAPVPRRPSVRVPAGTAEYSDPGERRSVREWWEVWSRREVRARSATRALVQRGSNMPEVGVYSQHFQVFDMEGRAPKGAEFEVRQRGARTWVVLLGATVWVVCNLDQGGVQVWSEGGVLLKTLPEGGWRYLHGMVDRVVCVGLRGVGCWRPSGS